MSMLGQLIRLLRLIPDRVPKAKRRRYTPHTPPQSTVTGRLAITLNAADVREACELLRQAGTPTTAQRRLAAGLTAAVVPLVRSMADAAREEEVRQAHEAQRRAAGEESSTYEYEKSMQSPVEFEQLYYGRWISPRYGDDGHTYTVPPP